MKYRDDVPLSEKEFAEIRARVMARVRRRSRVLPALAFAAAVVIAIVIIWPRPQRPAAHATVVGQAILPVRTGEIACPTTEPTVAPALVARRKPHRARHRTLSTPLVVHLQTANPNVRIIWITSKESS